MKIEAKYQPNIDPESPTFNLRWSYTCHGSTYAAQQIGNNSLVIGGSVWNRRAEAFTPKTRASKGLLTQLAIDNSTTPKLIQTLQLDSMVNVILPVGDQVFVGCKSSFGTYNLMQGNAITRGSDDMTGGGIYNALYDHLSDSIIAVTRNGTIAYIDPKTLNSDHLHLSSSARLWTLAQLNDGRIVAGDYDGFVYIVKDRTLQYTLDTHIATQDVEPKFTNPYKPSVFGITALHNGEFVSGTRSGFLLHYSGDSTLIGITAMAEEISVIELVPTTNSLLIGTRKGILYRMSLNEFGQNITEIFRIPPSLQTDNTIWSISVVNESAIVVVFADGQVICMELQ